MSEEKRKYEIMSDEIANLISEGQYAEAADIADQIDWRKVRSYTMLQRISDLYKINNRIDDALDIMLLAYDRSPNSKSIVFSICELYLESDDQISALEYMSVYNKMAPNDVGGDILKYKLLEYAEASYEDRVAQLEKIASKSHEPEWEYQLAYMNHCMGLATRCVECCDKLISIYGNGPFVIKAMELKMLHAKLTPTQQEIYDKRNSREVEELESYESDSEEMPGANSDEDDFHVKTIDMSKFNTINLQKALAESMKELMGEDDITDETKVTRKIASVMNDDGTQELPEPVSFTTKFYTNPLQNIADDYDDGAEVYTENGEPLYTDDGIIYYTADGVIYNGDLYYPDDSYVYEDGVLYDQDGNIIEEGFSEESEETDNSEAVEDKPVPVIKDNKPQAKSHDAIPDIEILSAANNHTQPMVEINAKEQSDRKFDDVLSVGNDGQISLVIPETEKVEKQITGQMNLEDVLAEWEKIKQKKQAQQDEEVRQNIIEQTGKIFADYDEAKKNGILAQIEEEQKMQRRVLNNQVELKKYEDIFEKEKSAPFDATAALNKVYDTPLWDEVDRAILEDKKQENNNVATVAASVAGAAIGGAAVVAGAVAAGGVTAGAVIGEKALDEAAVAADAVSVATEVLFDDGTQKIEVSEINNAQNDKVVETEAAKEEVIKEEPAKEEAVSEESPVEENTVEDTPIEENTENETVIEENVKDEVASMEDDNETFSDATDDIVSDDIASDIAEDASESSLNDIVNSEINTDTIIEDDAPDGDIDFETISNESLPELLKELTDDMAPEEELPEEYISDGETLEDEEEPVYESSLNTEQISDIGLALEEAADIAYEEAAEESNDNYDEEDDRDFSYDEQEIFEDFLYSKRMRAQILEAVDVISLASYVGNVIITGDSGMGAINLAKAMIKEIQLIDSNFIASKVAKISGSKMNQKDVPGMFMQLSNGALIIEKAGKLTKDTLESITRALENASDGIIVIMTDTKKEIDRIVGGYNVLTGYFNARIDIVPMSNNALVDYAKKYAYSQEYKIDEERAVLALHSRISILQVGEHNVTTREIEEIVDEAIEHSRKPHLSTFFNILLGKRYDYEDMIILRESDF